ncbi:MAG: hypothetical protein JO023_02140, partial [Chloroflexi bacterium]|nr:hypothetical protein [Chloroflexota bacterium]
VAAQSTDNGTPSTPSPDQVTAEQAARTAQPSPAPGPTGTPAPSNGTGASGGGGCFLGICDPGTWLQGVVNTIVGNFLKDLTSGVTSAVASFFASLNFITRTPPELSYQQDYVLKYEGAMRAVSFGLLAVVGMVTGFNLLWQPALGMSAPGATQILPRLVLGGILIATAHDWTKLAIDVNNAACDLVVGGTLPSTLTELVWSSMEPMLLLAFLVRAVLLVLLVLQLLMRLALVDILVVLAPLAALLWILPQTQGWAGLWAQRFVSTVFAQFVQMLALSLGISLVTGLPTGGAAALIQPLLGIAVLAVGLKIPSLMGGALAGGNLIGTITGAAAGAAVGMGSRGLLGLALGAGRAAAPAATAGSRPTPPAEQLLLPVSHEVPVGRGGGGQMTLPLSAGVAVGRGGAE